MKSIQYINTGFWIYCNYNEETYCNCVVRIKYLIHSNKLLTSKARSIFKFFFFIKLSEYIGRCMTSMHIAGILWTVCGQKSRLERVKRLVAGVY